VEGRKTTTDGGGTLLPPEGPDGETTVTTAGAASMGSVRIRLTGVPADRGRDVLKIAILPLATTGATVEFDMQIAAKSENGIPSETLDLTVAEGLRQLGIEFEVERSPDAP
jgi:hypothetical protein